MCAISVIHDYGRSIPDTEWNRESLEAFKKLVDEAKKFDEATKQPHCEDPEKLKWVEVVESKLE
jgi:hypothetical protein